MEEREYECEGCGETHTATFMDSIPAQSFTHEEVMALNVNGPFNAVAGFDYHPCDMHPENAVATEELMIERENEMIALRLVGDLGWAIDARCELVEGEDHNTAVQKTIEKMQADVLANDPHRTNQA